MHFDPELAEIRFGTGLGNATRPVADAGAILARLQTRDSAAAQFPISGFQAQLPDILKERDLNRQARRGSESAKRQRNTLRKSMRKRQAKWFAATLSRYVDSPDGFRERLTRFWADHFTVVGKRPMTRPLASTFVEDAIRPNLTGKFSDMLRAAETHTMMLDYLDQVKSAGEGSQVALRRNKGLNENLAREILELHTLGVDGPYTQTDVREFANLLAGYIFDRQGNVTYFPAQASPGAEVVLGISYGGGTPRAEDVHTALHDLSIHPSTAQHIARKLAVHFVADTPDAGLVHHIALAFQNSGGDLLTTYAAMLEHPGSWGKTLGKVKQPFDFIATSIKSLGATGDEIGGLSPRDIRDGIAKPMALMGQNWERPTGPDGWPEDGAFWITPQGLAARIQWALTLPLALQEKLQSQLPDPRDFAVTALGSFADERVQFAASAAETRWEGVGLVLSSPAFQRR